MFLKNIRSYLLLKFLSQGSGSGKYMTTAGCFAAGDGKGNLDLSLQAFNPLLGRTVEACVNYCRDLYYKWVHYFPVATRMVVGLCCATLHPFLNFHLAHFHHRVAGLQSGGCACSSMFGQFGPAVCNVACRDNADQKCGGDGANSVYFTGHNGNRNFFPFKCTSCSPF
jgi:hypothetical protein